MSHELAGMRSDDDIVTAREGAAVLGVTPRPCSAGHGEGWSSPSPRRRCDSSSATSATSTAASP